MKSITFLLPGAGTNPIGGYKVVYEYANRLQLDGFNVKIIYAASLFFKEQTIGLKIRSCMRYLYRLLFQNYTSKSWFKLETGITEIWVWSLDANNIPKTDIIVATSWETAEYLSSYPDKIVNRRLYLIQHYEIWKTNDENRLVETWKSSLEKIVIAPWLNDIATKLGEHAKLIENGFDFDYFRFTTPLEIRNPYQLCMLYHSTPWKGFEDGFSAIEKAREIYPQIELNLFGVYKKPSDLPNWVNYFQKPSRDELNRIYNESSIFVGASHLEGWGLTIGEAMQCGCAVVCTNNDGYLTMAIHNETALTSPVKVPEELTRNIILLIENKELRLRIASQGNIYIENFTWEKSYKKLVALIADKSHIE